MTEYFNQFLSILTILTNIVSILIILSVILTKSASSIKISYFIKKYSYLLISVLSIGGVIGSLIYSEIVQYSPCVLCWWQRIFLFPIAIITSLAVFKKKRAINDYILSLSIPGVLISFYQSLIQIFPSEDSFLCTGLAGDCSTVYFINYGFITLPFMAFSVFLLITIIAFVTRDHNKTIKQN